MDLVLTCVDANLQALSRLQDERSGAVVEWLKDCPFGCSVSNVVDRFVDREATVTTVGGSFVVVTTPTKASATAIVIQEISLEVCPVAAERVRSPHVEVVVSHAPFFFVLGWQIQTHTTPEEERKQRKQRKGKETKRNEMKGWMDGIVSRVF